MHPVTEFELTLEGTIERFDAPRFVASLADYLEVSPTDIQIAVAPGSVVVSVTVVHRTFRAAQAMAKHMSNASLASLSEGVGANVQSISQPRVGVEEIRAAPPPSTPPLEPPSALASPPSPSPTPQSAVPPLPDGRQSSLEQQPDAAMTVGLVVGTCLGGLLLVALVIFACYSRMHDRRQQRVKSEAARSAAPAVTPPDAKPPRSPAMTIKKIDLEDQKPRAPPALPLNMTSPAQATRRDVTTVKESPLTRLRAAASKVAADTMAKASSASGPAQPKLVSGDMGVDTPSAGLDPLTQSLHSASLSGSELPPPPQLPRGSSRPSFLRIDDEALQEVEPSTISLDRGITEWESSHQEAMDRVSTRLQRIRDEHKMRQAASRRYKAENASTQRAWLQRAAVYGVNYEPRVREPLTPNRESSSSARNWLNWQLEQEVDDDDDDEDEDEDEDDKGKDAQLDAQAAPSAAVSDPSRQRSSRGSKSTAGVAEPSSSSKAGALARARAAKATTSARPDQ